MKPWVTWRVATCLLAAIWGVGQGAVGVVRAATDEGVSPPVAVGRWAGAGGADEAAGRARLRALRREIAHHDVLYFQKAAPEISDFEYDRLKAELRALEARYPAEGDAAEAGGVGDDRTGLFATRTHRVAMRSLDKVYSDEEVDAFYARLAAKLRGYVAFRVEPKYDGLAVSLTYEHGRLVRAVTRGNGVEGDDITANARVLLRELPGELRAAAGAPWPDVVEVRGEIFMSLAEFSRLAEERESAGEGGFANPRNLAVGTVRSRDAAELAGRRLELVCYGWGAWEPAGSRPETMAALRDRLAAWGLPVPAVARAVVGAESLRDSVAELKGAGEAGGFPTDGVVIKLESVADQETLGEGPAAPRWAVARKFAPERAATRVRAITLQVGRSGVVTPVAELDPVELDGSTVARTTLHNADEIARRDVRVGDRVYVEKAGEIIPAIVGVDAAARTGGETVYVFPDTCPACASVLAREEGRAGRRCANAACPARLARRLEHFASPGGLAITGLGPALIDTLVERGWAKSPADFYRLTDKQLRGLPGMGARSAGKLRTEIEASRERAGADGARLIYALGLPGVGREAARRLARNFDGLAGLAQADEAALLRPLVEGGPGLGAASAREFAAYLREPGAAAELVDLVTAGVGEHWTGAVVAEARDGSLAGQVVVITGALRLGTRAEVAAKLEAAGAKVAADVTRETTLLVVGAEPGAKLTEARKRGISVIDEAELRRRLVVE